MYKMISIEDNGQGAPEEMQKALKQYPIWMHGDVRDAFQAAEEKDYEKSAEICCRLLDYTADPEIQMLLGTCYLMQGKMELAQMVFTDLETIYPGEERYLIYLGITYHALGMYEEAVKKLQGLYPLKIYRPFYYTTYGDCLQQIGRLKQSRDAFYEEAARFEKTGAIISESMLDGAFENLLYLDITLGNGKYAEDIKLYYDFLDQAEMTGEMQRDLAGNIVYFCSLMSNKWYRPLFKEFITHIRDRGYLTEAEPLRTLDSAFSSWESYQYHEDPRISPLMETYLESSHARSYSEPDEDEDERKRIEATALSYDWYMCQYAPEHLSELDYVEERYPQTYKNNREFFGKVKSDPHGTEEEVLDKLLPYARTMSRQEFIRSLQRTYQKACEIRKDPVYVYDGTETYRRIQPKVGRNDPCPCGSGKKYKKCCGR